VGGADASTRTSTLDIRHCTAHNATPDSTKTKKPRVASGGSLDLGDCRVGVNDLAYPKTVSQTYLRCCHLSMRGMRIWPLISAFLMLPIFTKNEPRQFVLCKL
jgi:hypothetical protein